MLVFLVGKHYHRPFRPFVIVIIGTHTDAIESWPVAEDPSEGQQGQ